MCPQRLGSIFLASVACGIVATGCATPQTSTNPMGGGGSGGSGPMPVMKDPSNYPQNTAGASFPYPQGHASATCTLAIYNTDVVANAYTNWKSRFFDGSRIGAPRTTTTRCPRGSATGC